MFYNFFRVFPEKLDKISYFVQRFPPIAGQVKTREEYYSYICMYVCRVQLGSFLGSPQRLLRSTTNVAAASRVVERRKIDTVGVFCVVLFSSLMQTRGLPRHSVLKGLKKCKCRGVALIVSKAFILAFDGNVQPL